MGKRTPPPPGEQPPAPPGDDASLFRAAIGPVRELPPQPAPPRKPPPRALPRTVPPGIRAVAAELQAALPRIDVLVNNAGLALRDRLVTEDGFENTFAVNHLAYFLLTRLLQPTLLASAPARVVNVSSEAHRWGSIRFDDLMGEVAYDGWKAYAQSKLANVLFTYELARRLDGTGVTANCLHPGLVGTAFARKARATCTSNAGK